MMIVLQVAKEKNCFAKKLENNEGDKIEHEI